MLKPTVSDTSARQPRVKRLGALGEIVFVPFLDTRIRGVITLFADMLGAIQAVAVPRGAPGDCVPSPSRFEHAPPVRPPCRRRRYPPFPLFWYRASGRRAFVREGPWRYTRHTPDPKLLDARAGAAKRKCDRDWRSCEANADWLTVADYVSDYTSFRREMRGERAARSP